MKFLFILIVTFLNSFISVSLNESKRHNLTRLLELNETIQLLSDINQFNHLSWLEQNLTAFDGLFKNFNLTAFIFEKDNYHVQASNNKQSSTTTSSMVVNNFTSYSQGDTRLNEDLNYTHFELKLISNFSLNNNNLSFELIKLKNNSTVLNSTRGQLEKIENATIDCSKFFKCNSSSNLQSRDFNTDFVDIVPDGVHLYQSTDYRLLTNISTELSKNNFNSFETRRVIFNSVNQSVINNAQNLSNPFQVNKTILMNLRKDNESTRNRYNTTSLTNTLPPQKSDKKTWSIDDVQTKKATFSKINIKNFSIVKTISDATKTSSLSNKVKDEFKKIPNHENSQADADYEVGRDINSLNEKESFKKSKHCSVDTNFDLEWDETDAGALAIIPCPSPYTGNVYRACFSSGVWDEPEFIECRLSHLKKIQNLISYHIHKHLTQGLYPLAEELSQLLTSQKLPIISPLDKLSALDALNSILKAKVKIKLKDVKKEIAFIKSLFISSEQLLTKIGLNFVSETDKNILITMKLRETIFGLRFLSENLLRALIVFCNDGNLSKIHFLNSGIRNIVIRLTHLTPLGSLTPLLSTDALAKDFHKTLPEAKVYLEDFQKLGVGVSQIWIKNITADFDNANYALVSDIIIISIVPPISIEVNFEKSPLIKISFNLNQNIGLSDHVKCGRIKMSNEFWTKNDCETIKRNSTWIKCSCREMGAFGALHIKSMITTYGWTQSNFHLNTLIIYLSCSFSLIILILSILCLIYYPPKKNQELFYLIFNLLIALFVIQITFLTGQPFKNNRILFTNKDRSICKMTSIFLHYFHLVSSFWMISNSIYLYQKLWRPQMTSSFSSNLEKSLLYLFFSFFKIIFFGSCFKNRISLCIFKYLFLFSWTMPVFCVTISYLINPYGYETKRYCWMSIEGGMLYSFIVPVSLLIMVNTAIMLLVLKRFFVLKSITHKQEIQRVEPLLRAGITFLPYFAVNWFLSVLALEDMATSIFQYLFALSNLIQHLLIFLFYVYQRHEINHFVKHHFWTGYKKRIEKDGLRLKKNSTWSKINSPTLVKNRHLAKSDQMLNSNSILNHEQLNICDHQPLLEYYTSHLNFDPTFHSTSHEGFQY